MGGSGGGGGDGGGEGHGGGDGFGGGGGGAGGSGGGAGTGGSGGGGGCLQGTGRRRIGRRSTTATLFLVGVGRARRGARGTMRARTVRDDAGYRSNRSGHPPRHVRRRGRPGRRRRWIRQRKLGVGSSHRERRHERHRRPRHRDEPPRRDRRGGRRRRGAPARSTAHRDTSARARRSANRSPASARACGRRREPNVRRCGAHFAKASVDDGPTAKTDANQEPNQAFAKNETKRLPSRTCQNRRTRERPHMATDPARVPPHAAHVPRVLFERIARDPASAGRPHAFTADAAVVAVDICGYVPMTARAMLGVLRRERSVVRPERLRGSFGSSSSSVDRSFDGKPVDVGDERARRSRSPRSSGSSSPGSDGGDDRMCHMSVAGLTGEEARNVVSACFASAIEEIHRRGGDVLKFAGDALFAAWFATEERESLGDCVAEATRCALAVHARRRGRRPTGPNPNDEDRAESLRRRRQAVRVQRRRRGR